VENVVKKINQFTPDVIVLTGDIGDGNARQYREDTTPLKGLRSKSGTFFVPGNHEYYWNVNEWLTVMNNMGIINLVNRGKVVNYKSRKILIAGIPDPVSGLSPALGAVQEAEPSDNADFKILLSHRPGIAHEASRFGFHLQLSGHTHGGQFFPWTIVVKFVHKFSLGLHRVGDMWLYISAGTGSWGPLLRVGTTPEITLLTLTSEKKLLN
jgi:predicted MPP superfamily phosphohydrolase